MGPPFRDLTLVPDHGCPGLGGLAFPNAPAQGTWLYIDIYLYIYIYTGMVHVCYMYGTGMVQVWYRYGTCMVHLRTTSYIIRPPYQDVVVRLSFSTDKSVLYQDR